ncbi:LacI family DNA-binding transcriptional regulator [Kineothrix sp. MB12-C1]|uniref:LacI family DNA-binding transcriptional regulator n=1 Tax=Kineothrix sp. MB12-C1 TaxID=3070215 RepID=UPI0027D2871D|nr:LacI family DNA-binding transcriptional regulator [Kineothrix sp. MB12-C1]WMC93755.1 LacI family DNA-binding transcriptional regulator [Kineothrix sp. MB12-C1]
MDKSVGIAKREEITGKLTIKDVAESLGVSESTVSRAISGKGRIGEATRKKVFDYIEKHNYMPGINSNGLISGRTHNIAWVMPGDCDTVEIPFFQHCMLGLLEVVETFSYHLIVTVSGWSDISHLEHLVNNRKVDGVVLARTNVDDLAIKFLKEKGIPFLTIGSYDDNEVIQIDHDHRSACEELTSMLLLKGYQRVGLIGGSRKLIVNLNRYQGYADALTKVGKVPNSSLIYMDVENYVAAEIAVEELLRKEVECILCMDDAICLYVLNKLHKEMIEVPRHMKVSSFYNSNLLESHIPAVSSIEFDARELGRNAGKILIDYMEGKAVETKNLLGYEIGLKESTKSN